MTAPEWFQLRRDVSVSWRDGRCLILSEDGGLELGASESPLAALLEELTTGTTLAALAQRFDPDFALSVITQLLQHRMLFAEVEDLANGDRHSQMFGWLSSLTPRPNAALKRLATAHVCVIGVGGIGGQVLEHLIGAGLGTAILVDGDHVSASNLNRQYQFTTQDIGKAKTATTAKLLREKARDATIHTVDRFLHSAADFESLDRFEMDLILNCADVPAELWSWAAGYASRRGCAYVSAGLGVNRGFWGPLYTKDPLKHLTAFEAQIEDELGPELGPLNCGILCQSSHGPYNSVISAMLASDAILHLSGAAAPRCAGSRHFVNFASLQITSLPA